MCSGMIIIDVDKTYTNVYTYDPKTKKLSAKKTYFCSLPEIVAEYWYEDIHHILLPESAYYFHTVQMEWRGAAPFSIRDYKWLYAEKIEEMVRVYGVDPYRTQVLCHVDGYKGEHVIKYLLGKTWKLAWLWYIYSIQPAMLLTLQQTYWRNIETITVSPKYLTMIQTCMEILRRDTFVCIVINHESASLYQITWWWYQQFVTAPLWLHILLEAAEDQWVQKFLFDERDQVAYNTVAQKLLLDSLWFYASALAEWIEPYLMPWFPVIFYCPLVTHTLFLEVIQATLQTKWVFILPFAQLPNSWFPSHTDVHIAAYSMQIS